MKTITLNLTDEQAADVLAQLKGTDPGTPPQTYPRGASIGGVTYILAAPVNPLWLGSPQDHVIGGAPGVRLADPGMPRSPMGFPTQFGRPNYMGTLYQDDAELMRAIMLPPPSGEDAGYTGTVHFTSFDDEDWLEFLNNQDVRHKIGGGRTEVAQAIFAASERLKGLPRNPNYAGKLK